MEENTNQATPQTNTAPTTETKKSGNYALMLLILLGLFVTFGLLIYSINMNNEADYLSVIKPANYLNQGPVKPVSPSPSQVQVEGTDSIDVSDIDAELQDLNSDAQGL